MTRRMCMCCRPTHPHPISASHCTSPIRSHDTIPRPWFPRARPLGESPPWRRPATSPALRAAAPPTAEATRTGATATSDPAEGGRAGRRLRSVTRTARPAPSSRHLRSRGIMRSHDAIPPTVRSGCRRGAMAPGLDGPPVTTDRGLPPALTASPAG